MYLRPSWSTWLCSSLDLSDSESQVCSDHCQLLILVFLVSTQPWRETQAPCTERLWLVLVRVELDPSFNFESNLGESAGYDVHWGLEVSD